MRPILVLLAVLAAGTVALGARTPAAVTAAAPADTQQFTERLDLGFQAFLRPGSAAPVPGGQEATGPRAPAHRGRTRIALDDEGLEPTIQLRFAARARNHVDHSAALALTLAGRASFHTATPPPFRTV